VAKSKRKSQWTKFGKVEVFEGFHALAVGSREFGYSVFASKEKVNIKKDGRLTWKNESGYMGVYQSKKSASSLVKSVDAGLLRERGEPEVIRISCGEEKIDAFSVSDAKTGGGLIVYCQGDIEGLVHESGHFELGHLDKSKRQVSRLEEEKEVIAHEIPQLKEMGVYTPEMEESIIGHFATYYKGSVGVRTKRARKAFEKIGAEV